MADHYIEFDRFTGNAPPEKTILFGVNDRNVTTELRHLTTISDTGIQSVHLNDDTTSYQNTSGFDAIVLLDLQAITQTQKRIVNIYDAPDDNSTAGATLRLTVDQVEFNANNDRFTAFPITISTNNFCVVENTTGAAGDIRVNATSLAVERRTS